ncbi:hypothetical protein MANES_17G038605v8 [Manihot esculenta]|uniref:Uncharacterized protein n=1 Tax=Manihot esculenta TaxID=3983 RepID=A0ACB7G2D3_MANES|nr:hypothetical protein MANES_17G038605v8 [Manihot esculenta]
MALKLISNLNEYRYIRGFALMDRRLDAFLPEISPTPEPFLPILAPSPLQPFNSSSTPKLSGLCTLNFTADGSLMSVASIACWAFFASLLANLVCCPQLEATLVILIGQSSTVTNVLALNGTISKYCLSDIEQILEVQGAADNVNFSLLSASVCPLVFPDMNHVAKGCENGISNTAGCCSATESYVSHLQKHSFLTNLQALDCATTLGIKLQKSNITRDVFSLCHISLKDFSLQDLNDNIPAPWPSSSQLSASSCNKTVKNPALPAAASGETGLYSEALVVYGMFAASVFIMLLL